MIKTIRILSLSSLLLTGTASFANEAEKGLFLDIQWDAEQQVYQVIATPTATPDVDINLSAQITLKVPHSADRHQRFVAKHIVSHTAGYRWIESSRADAPGEEPGYDYISFSLAAENGSRPPIGWTKGEKKALFSVENGGGCLGAVQLLADDDPFNVPLNSLNTNPGNQFTNLGWGNINQNHYLGITGEVASC